MKPLQWAEGGEGNTLHVIVRKSLEAKREPHFCQFNHSQSRQEDLSEERMSCSLALLSCSWVDWRARKVPAWGSQPGTQAF